MPKYFTHLNSSNAPANRLQHEALAVLKARRRAEIDAEIERLTKEREGL